MKQILTQICELLRECGQILRDADRSSAAIDAKGGHGNFVTEYDKKIQSILKERLAIILPEAVFIGEEDEIHNYNQTGYAFIVDPIDGTTNFIKNYHKSCISIALLKDMKQELAAIYNPDADEMYTAIKGKGAFMNGQPIHVSNSDLEHSLVLFGTSPYYENLSKISFEMAAQYLKTCIDVRRGGSAALDLCDVAIGRGDIYFEPVVCPWDQAAGSLIVTEAGGTVTALDGSPLVFDKPTSILASNGKAQTIKRSVDISSVKL